MSLFYFDLHDGTHLPDQEGVDLPDMEAVQAHAMAVMTTHLKEDARYAMSPQTWTLEVRDKARWLLFKLRYDSFEAGHPIRTRQGSLD